MIPHAAWSTPAQNLLQYIPQPNSGSNDFSTGAYGETTRDDKGSFRIDANTDHYGTFSGYYFFDDYTVNNPYPTGQGWGERSLFLRAQSGAIAAGNFFSY